MSTPSAQTMASESVASRAAAYQMPGVVVDGQDVVAVYETVKSAVDRARAGEGPTLIEARTYRYRDHAEYGKLDLGHRPVEELERWRTRDPIALLAASCDPVQVAAIDKEAAQEVADAVTFAKSSPMPGPEELFDDLWATPLEVTR